MSVRLKLLREATENDTIAPQAKVFYNALLAHGIGKEINRAEFVAQIDNEGNLVSRQPTDRVLSYYLQHFKKINLVEVIRPAPVPKAPKAEKPAKENSPTEAEAKPAK